jgi:hypothetical protein
MERSLGPLRREDVNCPLNKTRVGPALIPVDANRSPGCSTGDEMGTFERKRSEEKHENLSRAKAARLQAEIRARDLPNTKQEF